MCRHLILVDFDGVIVKNRAAGSYVKHKIEKFVQKVTPIKDPKLAEIYNKELYTSHGHTLLGLRKHGCDVSLAEFNKYLYGDTRCYSDLKMDDKEMNEWRTFRDEMKKKGYELKLFSNSGKQWMSHFLKDDADADSDLFEFHDFLDKFRDEPIYDSLLKPRREIYDMIMSNYKKSVYYFIDDKVTNFAYIQNDPRWIKLWLTNYDSSDHLRKIGDRYYATSSLSDVSLLL